MNPHLTVARLAAIAGVLGAGIVAFVAHASSGYKSAAFAAGSVIIATWLHEEHASDRNEGNQAVQVGIAREAAKAQADAASHAMTNALGAILPGPRPVPQEEVHP